MLAVSDVKPPLLLETIANVIFMLDVLRNFVTAVEVKGSLLVGVDPPAFPSVYKAIEYAFALCYISCYRLIIPLNLD